MPSKGRWKECGLAELHFTAFPVKLEHRTFRCIPNYAWALNHTYKAGYQLWPSTVHPLAKWLWLKTHVNCFLIADTVLRQSQNAELGFDWHFLKNMQQTWDVIQMAASVLNVKYLDTFWTRNNFFDNDFCKDWYHISFLMMYIVCH